MAANSDVGLSHFYRLQTQALHRIQESSPEDLAPGERRSRLTVLGDPGSSSAAS